MKNLLESPDRHLSTPQGNGKVEGRMAVLPARRGRRALILWALLVAFLVLLVVGIVPRVQQQAALSSEAMAMKSSLPKVPVVRVQRAPQLSSLTLPGTIRGYQETAIYPRTNGYVKQYLVEIGQPVKAGQLLAEIETPDLDKQLGQAVSTYSQSRAALGQARANLELAKVSMERWQRLITHNAVSQQEADTYRLQFEARQADVVAAEATVNANDQNVRRFKYLQSFQKITAPFDGVVTARNVDVGALVTDGTGAASQGSLFSSTELFRVAQTDMLRIYVYLPQSFVTSVQAGQTAQITVRDVPQGVFTGKVVRTAGALDPASRTLLTEVDVANPDRVLFPGMYAEVTFNTVRPEPPVLVPGSGLIVRPDGQYVAVVGQDRVVHFRKVTLGRDYGRETEIVAGLEENETVVSNPTDDVRDGAALEPIFPMSPAARETTPRQNATNAGEREAGERNR